MLFIAHRPFLTCFRKQNKSPLRRAKLNKLHLFLQSCVFVQNISGFYKHAVIIVVSVVFPASVLRLLLLQKSCCRLLRVCVQTCRIGSQSVGFLPPKRGRKPSSLSLRSQRTLVIFKPDCLRVHSAGFIFGLDTDVLFMWQDRSDQQSGRSIGLPFLSP